MKMRVVLAVALIGGLFQAAGGCRSTGGDGVVTNPRDTLAQVSTIDALMAGAYDGQMAFGELRRWGDFGLGTFHALDGEMVALDGEFYQVKADGTVRRAEDSETTPFACVTFFDEDMRIALPPGTTLAAFEKLVDGAIPTPNLFYALRLEGNFERVKARSVPAQVKPYPPLSDAVQRQRVFELEDVEGTVVGFRSPPFVKGVNLPGYHLHFLSRDRSGGGHLLDFTLKEGVLSIDTTPAVYLVLPEQGKEFFSADLGRDREKEISAVER